MSDVPQEDIFIPASPGYNLLRVCLAEVNDKSTLDDVLALMQATPILRWPVSQFPRAKGRADALRQWKAGDFSDTALLLWGEHLIVRELMRWSRYCGKDGQFMKAVEFPDGHIEPNHYDTWNARRWDQPSHWVWDRQAFAEEIRYRVIMEPRELAKISRGRRNTTSAEDDLLATEPTT